MKIAFLSGTSILRSPLFATWEERTVDTPHGPATLRLRGEHAVLNRHGVAAAPVPPHHINHRANIAALHKLGFCDVVALSSVGSLRADLPPGSLISCSDYVALQQGPATYHDNDMDGGAPGIANNLLPFICDRLRNEFYIETGQVYVQMRGPRFETKAEIRVIRDWGDVVGMTLAHEADLCTELGLRYNSLAMVDNLANGIEGADIGYAQFHELVRDNQTTVDRLLTRLLEIFA
ncbi:MTAP family purine nucleoside phosphorylase [Geminisphaera colitermitum]|uniref:MTAP family purine nucleoside phosphorylase n=1 Tax=Geminisphaera colitermitum TaxID=1148786 RepID=UPI0005BBA27F|nr:MTAP family purine nucleoside phosphorylase [Geminisphaera colitermitum]